MIELIVVITVILALFSAALLNISHSRARSRDARRLSDLKLIQASLELYVIGEGRDATYPDNYPYPIRFYGQGTSTLVGTGIYDNPGFEKYMNKTPLDPRNKPYIYFAPGCLRPGEATEEDPTIVSGAKTLGNQPQASVLSLAEIRAQPPGTYCPRGSGWLPYVLAAFLERGKVAFFEPQKALAQPKSGSFSDLTPDAPSITVVSVTKPLFPVNPDGSNNNDAAYWSSNGAVDYALVPSVCQGLFVYDCPGVNYGAGSSGGGIQADENVSPPACLGCIPSEPASSGPPDNYTPPFSPPPPTQDPNCANGAPYWWCITPPPTNDPTGSPTSGITPPYPEET